MEAYYTIFLYKGEIVGEDAEPLKYKKANAEDRCILLTDGDIYYDNFVRFPDGSFAIEQYEIDQGYVCLAKVMSLLEKNPELKEKWGTPENMEDIFVCRVRRSKIFNGMPYEVIPAMVQNLPVLE